MPRGKIKLRYIVNDSARKRSFENGKKTLVKKISELSTLCNVEIGAIIVSPFDATKTVWPSDSGVDNVVRRFKTMSKSEQIKKQFDVESFRKQKVHKAKKQLEKEVLNNKEAEICFKINKCLNGISSIKEYPEDIDAMIDVVGSKLKELDIIIKNLKSDGLNVGESSN